MSTPNDGGPAFPFGVRTEWYDSYSGNRHETSVSHMPGMTLRDYFAAKALASLPLLAWEDVARRTEKPLLQCWAESAYALADAMLAARERKGAA